jgi:hypothetical protein
MKISVAMCTYNGSEYLPAQWESILAQSRKPDEIVVCDDGSTDQSRKLLEDFAARSSISVTLRLNQQNLGIVKNFEQAIRLCTGDIIALSDQDDVWRGDKLQRIEHAFSEYSAAGVVFSDAEIVDQHLKPLNRRMWDEVGFNSHKRKLITAGRALEVLITGWIVTGATMAFRSELLRFSLPLPDGIAMIHDGWLALTAAAVTDVVLIDEPLIQYRQHGRQQIGAPGLTPLGPRGVDAIETALRRRNTSADLHKILETLADRLLTQAGSYDTRKALSFIDDYSFHLNVRDRLPQRRLSRLPSILRELLSLRYHAYAKGFKSAAKDLVS